MNRKINFLSICYCSCSVNFLFVIFLQIIFHPSNYVSYFFCKRNRVVCFCNFYFFVKYKVALFL